MAQLDRISIICSKGSLDMAYPGLVLANAARMSGIDVMMFFTFWGLDIVHKAKHEHLHLSLVGNPSVPIPAMIAGLPGMEALASLQMRKEMAKLDIPPVGEFLEMLHDAGTELYACQLAMDMFKVERKDLVPQVKDVITAMDFFEKTGTAQIIFI
ncbi:MAG TPA: DsrE/DsrF/DrsH-like family protein [Polyangiaceae bacterium]|jgi:peroxiredoxin family protein|nr:DsrE/DsrF/DrsH-like family protein [Polyangiaceae bacterium]